MIEAAQLTKRYGSTLALDHVTYAIQPGEVVGLLGPNGAGKTTMLKMLTGYLPPTEGSAKVVGKDIAHLSKGFRQRVGLAQAMLHDPEILILDEPTSGLDPNQQREVHTLIQTMRSRKTILLSTHTLSEASAVCDRVLI